MCSVKQFELAQLATRVLDGDAWLRALINWTGTCWTLRYAQAVIGQEPSTWPGQTWRYESLSFVAITLPATELVAALNVESDGRLQMGEFDVVLPRVHSSVQLQHRPSFELHDRTRMSLPSAEYVLQRLAGDNNVSADPGDFLVGPDCPSFTSLDAAYRGFFLDRWDEPAQEQRPPDLLHIRVLDDRAWLGPIHIRATEMTVQVCGTDPAGSTLEYFSPERRERVPIVGAGEITIHLPDGLPTMNTWLWLTEGNTWRDYRALTSSWASTEQLVAAGVEKEQTSRDEQADAEALVFGGEGPSVEFKRQLPETGQKTDSGCKTIAAFANGSGGTVVYGMDSDELTVVGLGEEAELKEKRDRIGQLIRTRVLPTPEFHVEAHVIDGKHVLFVNVSTGANPPYGTITGPGHGDKPEYHVRRGASTYPAQPSDFHEILPRPVPAAETNRRLPGWPR